MVGVGYYFAGRFIPGFVLSSFDPIAAIKSRIRAQTGPGISIRKSLVVIQFVIAQFLVIGTLVVVQQMDFFRNRPMGFDKKAIAIIDLPSNRTDKLKYDYLKQEMLQVPGAVDAQPCMDPPSSDEKIFNPIYFDHNPRKLEFDPEIQFADTSYLHTFGIKLVAGRLPYPADTIREILVNEAALRKMGLQNPDQVLGKSLSYNARSHFPIVGLSVILTAALFATLFYRWCCLPTKALYGPGNQNLKPEKLTGAMEQIQKSIQTCHALLLV